MLVFSQLGACGPSYSFVLAPRDLAYAYTNNNYIMQYESLVHELYCKRSEKIYMYLLWYKVFMHFTFVYIGLTI
jgi:hypothetical protein